MKICRFTLKDDAAKQPRLGLLEEQYVRDVTAVAAALPPLHWPVPHGDHFLNHLPALRPQLEALADSAPRIAREKISLLSPVANPGKFVCGVGNWNIHKAPLGMLGFLLKVTSANAGEGDGVLLRWPERTTVHEPELAIVIGKTCSNVTEAEALGYVAGYTCALDMTMKEDKEFFCFCKSFDTYGMLGPALVTADEIPDPSALDFQFWVNGELRGARNFSDLTGSPAQLVAFASSAMTLYPGDVIMSGTADVGPVAAGDVMSIEIPRVGRMDVPVSISPIARAREPVQG